MIRTLGNFVSKRMFMGDLFFRVNFRVNCNKKRASPRRWEDALFRYDMTKNMKPFNNIIRSIFALYNFSCAIVLLPTMPS